MNISEFNPRDQASETKCVDGMGWPLMDFATSAAIQFIDDDVKNIGHSSSNGSIKDSQNGTPNLTQPSRSFMSQSLMMSPTVTAMSNGQPSKEEEEDETLIFVDTPNSMLFCLLCKKVFKDPVITLCGHTFCRRCVLQSKHSCCPIDKVELSVCVANLAVSEQVGELRVRCQYGTKLSPDGKTSEVDPTKCPVTVKLSARKAHEQECEYSVVVCPNNPNCAPMLRRDLASHVLQCEHALCPQHIYGCLFHGTTAELKGHLESCLYEKMKEFIKRTETKVSELQQSLQQKDHEIGFLRAMLSKLSEKVEALEKNVEDTMEDGRMDTICSEIATLHDKFQMILSGQSGAFDPQQIFKCKGTFVGHGGPVWCLCVHQDYLFSGSSDKTIKVWDTASSYRCLKTMEGHQGIVLAMTIYGSKLYSASQDCQILVWNLETLEKEVTITAHDNPVCTLATAKNMLFSGSLKLIKVWDVHTMQMKRSITGINHWVRALASSQNYLYGGSFQMLKIWDLDTLECVRQLDIPGGSIYSIAITPHHILCGMYENCIHVWEVGSYHHVTTLVGHNGTVYAMSVFNSPSGVKVFSASYDRSLRVWSMDNMICTQTLVRHDGSVTCLATARGQIFSGATDSTVKVWR